MQATEDKVLAQQIKAGVTGRKRGHSFETIIANKINRVLCPYRPTVAIAKHVVVGELEHILLSKVLEYIGWNEVLAVKAFGTGKLATSEDGEKEIVINGHPISSSKSDVILELTNANGEKKYIGISAKQCNNKTPTNAQVYFTTARAFCEMLNSNGIHVSDAGVRAMREFCGDVGFRPIDRGDCSNRFCSHERYFWEEINAVGKAELEEIFMRHQNEVTKLLLQKGYADDPFPPEIIFHKTKKTVGEEEFAIYSMDEFIEQSCKFAPFGYSIYRVPKGRFKEPKGVEHQAPRFGVVQMQRGGQKQHPTQLQFNLKAGYFYYLDSL